MSKLKTPVPLNATIYNKLVKVFNDASNGIIDGYKYNISPEARNSIIELRKQFPTYQELKDSGIVFVDHPIYIDSVSKEEIAVRTWIGRFDDSGVTTDASILDASVVYGIAFLACTDPRTFQQSFKLKVRGMPKPELLDEE